MLALGPVLRTIGVGLCATNLIFSCGKGDMLMKRQLLAVLCVALTAAMLTGCMAMTSTVNLGDVAKEKGMINITTGDGTFENYTATSYVCAKDVGLAVGIPFIGKFMELVPFRDNEALLGDAADKAKEKGANAMINVNPGTETYWGIPFIFVGIYVDSASGTGIKVK
jgi:hypothetical protein